MERMQSLHWHRVDYDLSESGVRPLRLRELLTGDPTVESFLDTALGYPLSEGSDLLRERVASFYPGADPRPRHDRERRLGGEPPRAVVAARAGGPGGGDAAQLHAGLGPGPALHGERLYLLPAPAQGPLGPRPRRPASRRDEEDAPRARLQSQQPHGVGPGRRGDGGGGGRRRAAWAPTWSPTRSIAGRSSPAPPPRPSSAATSEWW